MDRRSRLLARLFAVAGVLLVPWVWVLIEQLHGQAGKRSFDSSWVGLDVLEAVCLLTVARLVSRRHRLTSPVAAATAAILCMDAWFDTWSAAPQLPYAEALAMAWFVNCRSRRCSPGPPGARSSGPPRVRPPARPLASDVYLALADLTGRRPQRAEVAREPRLEFWRPGDAAGA